MFHIKFNSASSRRHGLSLIEIMIAMVMTLIVLGAMMAAFSYASAEMALGRASIELNNRLVNAEEQLRRDLDRITVDLKPHHRLAAQPKGFVEIVDGAQTDYVPANEALDISAVNRFAHGGNQLVFGDRDDYFACTIKSNGKAFRGRYNDRIVESHLAEVAWFTVFDSATADPDDVLLVRRQLLILPNITPSGVVGTAAGYDDFLQNNDISVHRTPTGTLVANNLGNLALRANRYSHELNVALGPIGPDQHRSPAESTLEIVPLGTRYRDDHIMVSSVAAFDIQVFDPDAYVRVLANGDVAEPSDIGTRNQVIAERVGMIAKLGGFVDLGKGIMTTDTGIPLTDAGIFGGVPGPRFPFPPSPVPFNYVESVYDTGTSQYNRRFADHPGSNGVDDDIDGQIDEGDELKSFGGTPYRKVVAPYDAPIRGLKFTMRVLEPISKQVRQLTVQKSFVAE